MASEISEKESNEQIQKALLDNKCYNCQNRNLRFEKVGKDQIKAFCIHCNSVFTIDKYLWVSVFRICPICHGKIGLAEQLKGEFFKCEKCGQKYSRVWY